MKFILIAQQELEKLFATRRGWVSLLGFCLIWIFAVLALIRLISNKVRETQTEAIIGSALEQFDMKALGEWPAPELGLYWAIALYLLPLFALIISSDQIASDKTRRSLRYLTLRVNREQIFFGRFIGQLVIQFLLVIGTLVSVLALVAWTESKDLQACIEQAPMLIVNLSMVLLPYVALMALASVIAKSAWQATILAIIGWILVSIIVTTIQLYMGPFDWLNWLVPGSQISSLLSLRGWDTLQLAHIPIAHTVVLLVLGWWAMRRVSI
jgi:ABC-type transport system involved in multi-copper enzyme maturation permease subunit